VQARAEFRLTESRLLPLLAWAGFLLTWQIAGTILDPVYLSTPSAVAVAAYKLTLSGDLLNATFQSVQGLIIGFVVSIAIGIPVGLLMGRKQVADYALDLYVITLYVLPTVALLPLIILWFGLGLEAKVVMIALAGFFPLVINTRQGAKDLSASLSELGEAFCLSWHAKLRKITLWAILPYIVSGLRLGIGRALAMMIVAELISTRTQGLGSLLLAFSSTFRTDYLFVPITVLILLGVGLNALLRVAERQVAPWLESQRSDA
jgi:NitT/TauT family transport system permease protein